MKKKVSKIILIVVTVVILILGIIFSYCLIYPFTHLENNKRFIDGTNKIAKQFLSHIEIPETVTNVSAGAFSRCTALKNIEIPYSVKYIGPCAFSCCYSLESIEIPTSVTKIEYYTFEECTSLEDIQIPDSVTSIDYCAFSRCTSLKSIDIPNSVTHIGQSAFMECTSLESIQIPNNVTSIEDSTFYNCTSLKSIIIPNSVTHIGNYVFDGTDVNNIVFYVSKNSYAEQWALDNNYNIVYFEGSINADSNGNESERETANTLTDAEVGDIVYLGNYEQDNDTSNGKEEIAWRVLERTEQSDYNTEYIELLVLSEYVLDFRGSDYLNDWLEDTFMNEAFTQEELEQYFGRYSKHVGLLRESEMDNYFTSAEDYRGVATEYVKATSGTNGSYIGWWLELGKYVGDGYNLNSKYDVRDGYSSERGVRPIVRIIIEK